MERPRKTGAKWTGRDIAPDEVAPSGVTGSAAEQRGFEAKRDRWAGYDSKDHLSQIEEWEAIEEERQRVKEREIEASHGAALETNAGEEDKYAESADMPGQKVDLKTRMTIRNLRLREDTAKYLLNLDPNSAAYDPKTRSMKGNPMARRNVSGKRDIVTCAHSHRM